MKKLPLSIKISILALLISILNVISIFFFREIKINSYNRSPINCKVVLNEMNDTVEIYKDGKLTDSIKIVDGLEISVSGKRIEIVNDGK